MGEDGISGTSGRWYLKCPKREEHLAVELNPPSGKRKEKYAGETRYSNTCIHVLGPTTIELAKDGGRLGSRRDEFPPSSA